MTHKIVNIFFCLCMYVLGFLFVVSALGSTNYNISNPTLSDGAGKMSSTRYLLDVVLGVISGNMNTSSSLAGIGFWYAMRDIIPPSITLFSCDPIRVTLGSMITCTCRATDAVDTSPRVSFTQHPLTIDLGTYTTICTATDSTGNTATSPLTYTVEPLGGENTPLEKEGRIEEMITKAIEAIQPREVIIVENFGNMPLEAIQIRGGSNTISGIEIIVATYKSEPVNISPKSGKVYKYFEITEKEKKLENAKVEFKLTFKVAIAWLESNQVSRDEVELYTHHNEQWVGLSATYKESRDEFEIFEAIKREGLSIFAIGEKRADLSLPSPTEISKERYLPEEARSPSAIILVIVIVFIAVVIWFLSRRKKIIN